MSPPPWGTDGGCCGSPFFRLCPSSVSFILTRRAAIFLALTKGCSTHLVRSGRQRGQRRVEAGGDLQGRGEVRALRAGREAGGRRLSGCISFGRTASSAVVTAIRGFQVRRHDSELGLCACQFDCYIKRFLLFF